MSWHQFQAGEAYTVDEILVVLQQRLSHIKDKRGKSEMIAEFELHQGTDLVWQPFWEELGTITVR